jgi:hypothetical protein
MEKSRMKTWVNPESTWVNTGFSHSQIVHESLLRSTGSFFNEYSTVKLVGPYTVHYAI